MPIVLYSILLPKISTIIWPKVRDYINSGYLNLDMHQRDSLRLWPIDIDIQIGGNMAMKNV